MKILSPCSEEQSLPGFDHLGRWKPIRIPPHCTIADCQYHTQSSWQRLEPAVTASQGEIEYNSGENKTRTITAFSLLEHLPDYWCVGCRVNSAGKFLPNIVWCWLRRADTLFLSMKMNPSRRSTVELFSTSIVSCGCSVRSALLVIFVFLTNNRCCSCNIRGYFFSSSPGTTPYFFSFVLFFLDFAWLAVLCIFAFAILKVSSYFLEAFFSCWSLFPFSVSSLHLVKVWTPALLLFAQRSAFIKVLQSLLLSIVLFQTGLTPN